jgi:DNA helicase-2/ATP-dependent DNA helicase PcrA
MNAITKDTGPCVVLAGAGTGKTYTIVEKLKHMIGNEIYAPQRIVCITFSNEAANNLLSRVQKCVNIEHGKEPIINTFHAFSADLLRKYGDKIGINKEFHILEPDEAKIMLHRNFKTSGYNCHRYISSIGTAKDLGITSEQIKLYLAKKMELFKGVDIEKELEQLSFELQTVHLKKDSEKKKYLSERIRKMSSIIELRKFVNSWDAYEKIKKKKNYQDYSDLNNNALRLLKENPQISADFDYIIVDEFQDTNKVQLEMLLALAVKGNITIVGDLNQSIYRFRGAYKENFAIFKKEFNVKQEDVFNLDRSFRSPNKVLHAAHKLISNNYEKKEDCFMVENNSGREGDKISVFELKNGREEARKVCEIIEKEVARGVPAEEICVMFRTHQQGRVIKRALELKDIKYCAVSNESLIKQKSVKQIIDYLVIADKLVRKAKGGEQEFWDLLYNLKFIASDLLKIGKFIKQNREDECIINKIINGIDELNLSEQGRMSIKIVIDKINEVLKRIDKPLVEFLNEVYRISGILNQENIEEAREISANLNRFLELAKSHTSLYEPDLYSFLNYLEIVETLGIDIDAAELEHEGVRLMTLHATKGLEYKTVIVTNLAHKRFPMEKYSTSSLIPMDLYPELAEASICEDFEFYVEDYERRNQLLDERRLCYVAFTRTKERLFLTYAQDYGGKKFLPSQFLQEIEYKNNVDIDFVQDLTESYVEPDVIITPASQFGRALASHEFESIITDVARPQTNAPEHIVFSPSALLLFDECEKSYEYRYVYNMPEKKTLSWDAMRLGSFVHSVLEQGVNSAFKSYEDFLNLAREMHLNEDWESVDLGEALKMIKVFFERNKNRYNEKSETEIQLNTEIAGMRFMGFADRIDFTDKGAEIIDYKTGKSQVKPKHREWQLGYYAIAAKKKFGNVCKVSLDMLRLEKPLEFEIDSSGNARAVNGEMHFNVNDIEDELAETAGKIISAYKSGFKPCLPEKNCEFCQEYVYGN